MSTSISKIQVTGRDDLTNSSARIATNNTRTTNQSLQDVIYSLREAIKRDTEIALSNALVAQNLNELTKDAQKAINKTVLGSVSDISKEVEVLLIDNELNTVTSPAIVDFVLYNLYRDTETYSNVVLVDALEFTDSLVTGFIDALVQQNASLFRGDSSIRLHLSRVIAQLQARQHTVILTNKTFESDIDALRNLMKTDGNNKTALIPLTLELLFLDSNNVITYRYNKSIELLYLNETFRTGIISTGDRAVSSTSDLLFNSSGAGNLPFFSKENLKTSNTSLASFEGVLNQHELYVGGY